MQVSSITGITGSIRGPEQMSMLKDFAFALKELLDGAEKTSVDFAKREPVETHRVMIAAEKAVIGLSLVLQLRNRAIEAYQEIMHMQV